MGIVAGTTLPTRAPRQHSTDTLRDVVRGLQKRITLSKLVSYDKHVRPYLAALLVGAVSAMGEKLVVPDDLEISRISKERFQQHVQELSNSAYDESGALGDLMGTRPPAQGRPLNAQDTLISVLSQ